MTHAPCTGAVSFGFIGILYALTIAMGWSCYWVINVMVKSYLLQNIFIITGFVILCMIDKWRTRAHHFYHHTILLYHYSVGKSANAPCPIYSVGKWRRSRAGVVAALPLLLIFLKKLFDKRFRRIYFSAFQWCRQFFQNFLFSPSKSTKRVISQKMYL